MSAPLRLDTGRLLESIRSRLLAAAPPPVHIRPVGVGNSLYGVLIKVEGVGIIGQYLSHTELTLTGPDGRPERYWEIIYGVSEVFARVEVDGAFALVPVVVYGMLTPDGRRLLEQGPPLYEHKRVKGSILVPVSALVNLDDVMSGSDVVLRVDPYGVLQPGDLRERVVALSKRLAALQRAYAALESQYLAERSAREVSENQLVGLRAVLDSVKAQLSVAATTLEHAESAMLNMWSRIRSLSRRVASESELRDRLESMLAEMSEVLETARLALRRSREIVAEVVKVERPEEKPSGAEEEKREEAAAAGEAGGEAGGGAG
ncbi:MAG: hypothetical protein QXZ31_09200 [Thermofilaceae archaeon]